jgi:hypothetical protein
LLPKCVRALFVTYNKVLVHVKEVPTKRIFLVLEIPSFSCFVYIYMGFYINWHVDKKKCAKQMIAHIVDKTKDMWHLDNGRRKLLVGAR